VEVFDTAVGAVLFPPLPSLTFRLSRISGPVIPFIIYITSMSSAAALLRYRGVQEIMTSHFPLAQCQTANGISQLEYEYKKKRLSIDTDKEIYVVNDKTVGYLAYAPIVIRLKLGKSVLTAQEALLIELVCLVSQQEQDHERMQVSMEVKDALISRLEYRIDQIAAQLLVFRDEINVLRFQQGLDAGRMGADDFDDTNT
jgi:hypothetical protein